jgi:hypothetical protein
MEGREKKKKGEMKDLMGLSSLFLLLLPFIPFCGRNIPNQSSENFLAVGKKSKLF